MAKIEIDSNESPIVIRLAAEFLHALADLAEGANVTKIDFSAPHHTAHKETGCTVHAHKGDMGAGKTAAPAAAPPPPPAAAAAPPPAGSVVTDTGIDASKVGFGQSPLPPGAIPIPPGAPSIAAADPSMIAPDRSLFGQLPPNGAPPAPPAPGAAAMPSNLAALGELDKDGMPWDERIHQASKHKKATGQWKLKRGIDQVLVATVMADLRDKVAAAKEGRPLPASVAPIAPNVNTAPPPPATADQPTTGEVTTFPALMAKIKGLVNAGRLTNGQAIQAAQSCGMQNLQMLIAQPAKIPDVSALLDAMTM